MPLIIENEDAARLLLAFDLEQPWSCHQTYILFDELHTEVFARPEVSAGRILALHYVYQAILEVLDQIEDKLLASYSLTKFFLLYLLKEALKQDDVGNKIVQKPEQYLHSANGKERLIRSVKAILGDLVVDLNAEMKEREARGEPFDYKREFKGVTAVRKLVKDIIPAYQKAVNRGRAASFGDEWNEPSVR